MDKNMKKNVIAVVALLIVLLYIFAVIRSLDNEEIPDVTVPSTTVTTVMNTTASKPVTTVTPTKPTTAPSETVTYGYVPSPQARRIIVEPAD